MFLPTNIFSRVKHIGISLSSYAVRAVMVNNSGEPISKAEVVADKLLIDGEKVNQPKLTETFEVLKQQLKLNTFYAAFSIPEKLAYSREHMLPNLNDEEIAEAVNWQLGSIFPFKPEDLYADWKLIDRSDTETKIVVTAVNRQLIDDIVACCRAATIHPISFKSSAATLATSLTDAPENAIIIELDNLGSSSTLVEKGVASLTITTNFATASDSHSLLADIVANLKQLIKRVQSPDTETKVKIYCTGEKALPELISAISDQIGLPIEPLHTDQIPGGFQTAYLESVATIEAPESNKSINLLPSSIEQQYRVETEIAQAKTVAIYGIAFSAVAFVISLGLFIIASLLTTSSAKQLASIPDPQAPPQGINVGLYLQKSQKITQLQAVKYFPDKQFEAITNLISPQVLKQYSYDAAKKTITITLGALERNQLFELKNALDNTQLFNQIAIPLSALSSDKSESISIAITIKPTTP